MNKSILTITDVPQTIKSILTISLTQNSNKSILSIIDVPKLWTSTFWLLVLPKTMNKSSFAKTYEQVNFDYWEGAVR